MSNLFGDTDDVMTPLRAYKSIPIAALIPYARNARTHSEAQVAQIAASIREFGWTNPVLVDEENGLIAGHGRVLAARLLGMLAVPAIVLEGLSKAQRQALVIADNKLALNAAWNDDLLRIELADLKSMGFDLNLVGFDKFELAALDTGNPAIGQSGSGSLAEKFGVPPFSVLNAREGWWQDRKRAWLALGIKSEIGRGDTGSTSARVGDDDPATYRTIGGRKANAIPGGAAMPLDRAKRGGQRHPRRLDDAGG